MFKSCKMLFFCKKNKDDENITVCSKPSNNKINMNNNDNNNKFNKNHSLAASPSLTTSCKNSKRIQNHFNYQKQQKISSSLPSSSLSSQLQKQRNLLIGLILTISCIQVSFCFCRYFLLVCFTFLPFFFLNVFVI